MNVQIVGCSHHGSAIAMREKLAFTPGQAREALDRWRRVFPRVEIVRISDAGRYSIVETRHGDHLIKLLAPEGEDLPSEDVHIRFDPGHTQVYADGWMVS